MGSVRDFGALGNGQNDDTAAIMHALENSDGDIVFPRGNYLITQPLVVDLARLNRTSIRGLGGLAKLIMAGPGPAISLIGTHPGSADPKSFQPGVWAQERMPTVEGIEIEGAHSEADGIHLEGVVQPTLSRVLIRRVRTAVHIFKRARNVLIDACHFYNNTGIGVHLDHVNLHQCIISASHISYCRRGGIRVDNSEIRNFQITGNDIEYNNSRVYQDAFPDALEEPTAEIYIDIQDGSVCEGTICSNTIQATVTKNGANIRMIGSPGREDRISSWAITGNMIGHQETNLHLSNVWGITIAGNQIYGATNRNLLLEDSKNIVIGANTIEQIPAFNALKLGTGVRFVNSQNIIVSGLQIQDGQTVEKAAPPVLPEGREALVELVNCQRFNITGCQILDGAPVGLLLQDCQDTSIQQCQIFDQRATPQMAAGIELRGELKNVLVGNCQIGGASETPIRGASHPGVLLNNNVTS